MLIANKSDWVIVDDNKFSDDSKFSSNNNNSSYLTATTQGPSILSIDNGFQKQASFEMIEKNKTA